MTTRFIGVLGLFWLCISISHAQRSMTGNVQGAIPPKICTHVDSLNELAFLSDNPQEIEKIAKQALALAIRTGCIKGRADSYFRLGRARALVFDPYHAKQFYLSGISLRQQLKDSLGVANGYIALGQLYKNHSKYDSAQLYYRTALPFIQGREAINLAYFYNGLGSLYVKTNTFGAARKNYQQGLRLYAKLAVTQPEEKEEIQLGWATIRMNLAALMQDHFSQYSEARDSLLKSLRDFRNLKNKVNIPLCCLLLGNNAYYQRHYQQAQNYYQQAEADSMSLDLLNRAKIAKNLGRVYLDLGQYTSAKSFFDRSKKLLIPVKDSVELALLQFELGNFYYEQGLYADAALNYRSGIDLQKKDTLLYGRSLFFIAEAYQALKQFDKSKYYQEALTELLSTIKNEGGKDAFQELLHYQVDKQRLLKQLLQAQNELLLQRSLLIGGTLAGMLLLALGGFYWSRQHRLVAEQKAQIAEQNEQIALQEKLDLLKNRELETHYAWLEGQDNMQKQIGRELHEGVGTLLSTVKLNLATVDEVLDRLPHNHQTQYSKANRLLDEACVEVRRISHELGSALLSKFGLKAQLEALADVIPGSGKLQVEMITFGLQDRLPYKTELNIYRIVQELVNNTIKHAQASKISIQVNRFSDAVNILVEDNGKGFDQKEIEHKRTAGIKNLEARTHELEGVFLLDTKLGRGTIVSIDFPISSQPNEKN